LNIKKGKKRCVSAALRANKKLAGSVCLPQRTADRNDVAN